jgi:hypothetical protein
VQRTLAKSFEFLLHRAVTPVGFREFVQICLGGSDLHLDSSMRSPREMASRAIDYGTERLVSAKGANTAFTANTVLRRIRVAQDFGCGIRAVLTHVREKHMLDHHWMTSSARDSSD